MNINFYNVDLAYVDFLKKYETEHRGFTKVPNVNYHSGNNKFFYGAVLNINSINFFVPVSSKTTPKQDDIVIKVKDRKNPYYGTLRFAYMIPIPPKCLKLLIRDNLESKIQSERIRKELAFCRKNKDKIERQAKRTYERITNNVSRDLTDNSCDFKVLEKAYIEYCILNKLDCSCIDGQSRGFIEETLKIKEWSADVQEKYAERMEEINRHNKSYSEK